MRIFEVKRQLGHDVSVHHIFPYVPMVNAPIPYRAFCFIDLKEDYIQNDREDFWKLQGDVLGSMVR